MKKIKMFAAVLAAVLGLAMIPDANAVTAKAEEPVTYSVKCVNDGDSLTWRFQANTSTYDDNGFGRELYYLLSTLKDGDVVVIYNNEEKAPLLDLGDIRLGSLTITEGQFTMVKVGSADNFYANRGSNSSITGTITNASVYLTALANFNNDVQNLTQYFDPSVDENGPTIGCGGKVTQFTTRDYSNNNIVYTIYEVKGLNVRDGVVQEGCSYSSEPVAASGNSSATNSSSSNSSAASSSSSNSSEYDDVPKTGQNIIYLWLLGAAAACFVGSGLLRKASH